MNLLDRGTHLQQLVIDQLKMGLTDGFDKACRKHFNDVVPVEHCRSIWFEVQLMIQVNLRHFEPRGFMVDLCGVRAGESVRRCIHRGECDRDADARTASGALLQSTRHVDAAYLNVFAVVPKLHLESAGPFHEGLVGRCIDFK